jgi:flagellar basal-body rod protein FlgF
MGSGIYIAAAGAVAQENALSTVANNISNAATTGFRAARIHFAEALTQAQGLDTAYVGVAGVKDDTSQGSLRQTGNPLDVAIQGEGFFTVETPNGPRYTRAGDFTLNTEGRLVNSSGYPVQSAEGGALVIPPGAAVSVAEDGTLSANGESIGRLALARFAPESLSHAGENLWSATQEPLPEDPAAPLVVQSGVLEQSNVSVMRGMVDLIKVSRTYESLHRVIENFRQLDERTARSLGGPK